MLYMGPLLAGMAGFGWAMVPPFVSIFVLWLVLLRPQQWPRSNAEWLTRRAWLAALSQVLSQIVLVSVLFGIGRGIGGVLGTLPLLHPLLPVALSFMAIPLLRLFWDTDRALAEDLSIDELLYPHAAAPRARGPMPAAPATEAAILPLLALDGTEAAEPDVRAALEEALDVHDGWTRLAALSAALAAAPTARHAALRRALIDWATDTENGAPDPAPGAIQSAFAAAGADDALLRRLMARVGTPDGDGGARQGSGFPDPAVIEDLARRDVAPDLAADLSRLAGRLRAARAQGAPAAAAAPASTPRRPPAAPARRLAGRALPQG